MITRIALALAPTALTTVLILAGSVASGCSGSDSLPSSAAPISNYDDPCMAALGTPKAASACAGSPLSTIAEAQLKFTVAYLNGQDQCAATDVATASACYPASQQALLGSLRASEDPLLSPSLPDFGTDAVDADGGGPDAGY